MTPDDEQRLAELLAPAKAILLDFDGPVCSIFAGYPAPQIAEELRGVLRGLGVDLDDTIAAEPDPLEVLRWTSHLGDQTLTEAVEDALRIAELNAVETAAPTPYAREVIVAAWEAGKRIAIISNNSAGAITKYLTAHRLASYMSAVTGRAYAEPELMKPNPHPIRETVAQLDVEPGDCVLIGDSHADMAAARLGKTKFIGYANRPLKSERFRMAGVDGMVKSLADVARHLTVR